MNRLCLVPLLLLCAGLPLACAQNAPAPAPPAAPRTFNIGGKPKDWTVTFPPGTPPLGPAPLTADGGKILSQSVMVLPDGSQQVVARVQIAGGQGGKLTLTAPAAGLTQYLFNSGRFDYSYPLGARRIGSPVKGNVFIGGPPTFTFSDPRNVLRGYEVRDYAGRIAAAGALPLGTSELTLPGLTRFGPYTLWLTGAVPHAPYGNVVTSTVFGLAPATLPGTNLPGLPPKDAFTSLGEHYSDDIAVRGYVQGAGPERLSVQDAAAADGELTILKTIVAAEQAAYVQGPNGALADPVRGRPLMVNFPNYRNTDAQNAGVTRVVAALSPLGIRWYEGANEPPVGAAWVPNARAFDAAVKAGSPDARVMGPAGVSVLGGLDAFLKAGGGDTFDGFSFHAYNAVNGDYDMAERVLGRLDGVLTKYGQQNKPRWQTEQGQAYAIAGVVTPRHAVGWVAVQTLALERHHIPVEHTPYWYVKSAGFWDFATWLENTDGSLNGQAYLLREYAAETWAKPFASAYSFGTSGDTLWYGNRYDGQGPALGHSVSIFAGKGTRGEVLRLRVSGKAVPPALTVADAWGNPLLLPVVAGTLSLPPTDGLFYSVRHPSGVTLTPLQTDFGPDLARAPAVTVTTPTNPVLAAKLVNGLAENPYDGSGLSFGSDSGWPVNPGLTGGKLKNDTHFPYVITLDLGASQPVSRVVIKSPPLWQSLSAIINADVETSPDGQRWTTRRTLQQPPQTVELFSDQRTFASHAWDYFPGQSTWDAAFLPVPARYVRLVIRAVTHGGQGDLLANRYGGQPGPEQVSLSEIAVYSK